MSEEKENKTNCALEQHTRTRAAEEIKINNFDDEPMTDGFFREYRMAVLFSSEDFNSRKFNKDTQKVRTFLAQLETFLNEIYVRDLGIRLKIVDDEKLINTGLASVYLGVDVATKRINDYISPSKYDIGVALAYQGDDVKSIPSVTYKGGIAYEVWKGCLTVTDQEPWTVAHELGHLFGGTHTFTTGAEPNPGQSILGYGRQYNFISKSTMQEVYPIIRLGDKIVEQYNKDFKHYDTTNHPPVIDREKMKSEYIVPENTFFSIHVYANDADGDKLYYGRQQEGYYPYKPNHFSNFEPTRDSILTFGRVYNPGNLLVTPGSDNIPVGEYDFSIFVNDAPSAEEAIEKRKAPLYDVFKTKIKVIKATPFKITSGYKKEYKWGERITLKWDVDKDFFKEDSKVRVLLSTDGGKTFGTILVPETNNDGECEVVLPQIELDRIPTYGITAEDGKFITINSLGKGVIKLETLDGFYDITDNDPHAGGFEIKKAKITLNNAPTNSIITVKSKDEIPEPQTVTATNDQGKSVDVEYNETNENGYIKRLWTAKSNNEEVSAVQYIKISTTTTGIKNININNNTNNNYIYDLNGKVVTQPLAKGIYIKNGKKFIVK